jgi:uncharacterized glyoxalase superfamily protein PhnB
MAVQTTDRRRYRYLDDRRFGSRCHHRKQALRGNRIAIFAHFISRVYYIFEKKMKNYTLILTFLLACCLSLGAQTPSTNKPISLENISPNIYVRNIRKTVDFYKLIGFEVVTTVPDKGDPIFVLMRCGGVAFMFQTFESIGNTLPLVSRNDGGSLLLYIKVENIQALFEKIKDKVSVLHGLEQTFYGATEFSIKDNNNYMLTFAEYE